MEVTKIDRIALRQLYKGNALAIAMTESVRFKGKLAAKNGRYETISIPNISLTSVTCKYYNLRRDAPTRIIIWGWPVG
jgi:hypothetical protein